jgi:hypothetical protein
MRSPRKLAKKPLVQKRLSDYFPEEHIVITSGIVLLAVAFLTLLPSSISRGLSIGIASTVSQTGFSTISVWEAFFIGFAALAFVFILVFVVQRYLAQHM